MRSGVLTAVVLLAAAVVFILAYRQHMQGNFHRLKQRMADERPQAEIPLPGGQEAIELSRTRLTDDAAPEFLSVTLLPGRGMNVLQIGASIPGQGQVDLLASPTLDAVVAAMTGKGPDAGGRYSMDIGGAFEVPWADAAWSPADNREHPHTLATANGRPLEGGLLLAAPADASDTATLPDGGQAETTFLSSGGQWPSATETKVAALLSSHTLDLTVTVTNTGNAPEPVGIGWRPRFAISRSVRSQMRLRVPGDSVVEQSRRDGLPTGKLIPVVHTALDFTSADGAALPGGRLDECFADLTQAAMDNGPAAELIDPARGYRLRITALSPEIRAMRVTAPADRSYVTIGPQYNYPDPFGHEWVKTGGAGMVVLQPGQSTKWQVRLEILPLKQNGAPE